MKLNTPDIHVDSMDIDAIYVLSDGTAVVTPDGVGRYFYDDLATAQYEHGDGVRVYHVAG